MNLAPRATLAFGNDVEARGRVGLCEALVAGTFSRDAPAQRAAPCRSTSQNPDFASLVRVNSGADDRDSSQSW
jgi:hypothetical protein